MLRQPFDKSTTQVCAHAPVLLWHLPVRKGLCLEPKIGPGQCNSVHSAMHIYSYVWSIYCWHFEINAIPLYKQKTSWLYYCRCSDVLLPTINNHTAQSMLRQSQIHPVFLWHIKKWPLPTHPKPLPHLAKSHEGLGGFETFQGKNWGTQQHIGFAHKSV